MDLLAEPDELIRMLLFAYTKYHVQDGTLNRLTDNMNDSNDINNSNTPWWLKM